MKKKTLAMVLALVLVLSCAVGGSLAWLHLSTGPVQNTFTYGNVGAELKETTGEEYIITPGADITKDPKITVSTPAGYDPVDVYAFIKVVKAGGWVDGKVSYQMADGWTELEGVDNVYWREVAADAAVKSFSVLKDDKITVSSQLNIHEIETAAAKGQPTLTITGYVAQKAGMASAADAWTKAGFM